MKHGSPAGVLALLAGFAAVHSLLASSQAKAAVSRLAGERYRDGAYRAAFLVQSTVSTLLGVVLFSRLPDRELYRVPRPWSWLMRTGQLASLALATSAAWVVGPARITGLAPLLDLLAGRRPAAEPEAQGPPAAGDGEMDARGGFRISRHPANVGAMGVLLLLPRMTVNRLVLALAASAYLVLGSVHEEVRLRRAYGTAYERYRQKAPFLLGRPRE